MAIFSGDIVAREFLLGLLTPFGANALLFLIAGLIFFLASRIQKISLKSFSSKDTLLLAINALWSSAMVVCLQKGLTPSSAGLANAVFCAYPLVTYICSILFLKEDSLSLIKLSGFLITFVGFYMIVSVSSSTHTISGWVIAATLLIGSQLCLVRYLTQKYSVTVVLTWQHGLTGLFCMLAALCSGGFLSTHSSPHPLWAGILAFTYIAIFVNVMAYAVQGYLVKKYPASTVSSFILFRPALGFIFAALFLKEPLSIWLFIAAGIIGIGILIVFKGASLFPGRECPTR